MAKTDKQVRDAVARVGSGHAREGDDKIVAKRARVAGSAGSDARKAQEDAGKDPSKSWGNW